MIRGSNLFDPVNQYKSEFRQLLLHASVMRRQRGHACAMFGPSHPTLLIANPTTA